MKEKHMPELNRSFSVQVKLRKNIQKYWMHYLMLLPAVILLFVMAYIPMVGLIIAFKDYKVRGGISGFLTSKWVGLENFWYLKDPYFWTTVRNTLSISVYRMLVSMPLPILVAIMLNEVRSRRFKRIVQSFSYLPNFVSWIIVSYMINQFLGLDTGLLNNLFRTLGMDPVYFMGKPEYFPTIVVLASIWKNTGWGTIIYLAALSNVDPQLQEAAIVDGAGRLKRIWHVDLPAIKPTIVVILILSMPGFFSAGYEQILPLQNPANMVASDVLEIYVMRLGLRQAQYSLSTAIGLVLSMINLAVVLLSNYVSRLMGEDGLF